MWREVWGDVWGNAGGGEARLRHGSVWKCVGVGGDMGVKEREKVGGGEVWGKVRKGGGVGRGGEKVRGVEKCEGCGKR